MRSISICKINILLYADIYAIAGNSGSNGGYSTFNDMSMFESYGRISAMKVCIGWYIDRLALCSIYVRTVPLYETLLISPSQPRPGQMSRTVIISCLLCSGTVITYKSSLSQINAIVVFANNVCCTAFKLGTAGRGLPCTEVQAVTTVVRPFSPRTNK